MVASMKVPTKEEGKSQRRQPSAFPCSSLDEGPYGKVGNDICNQTAPVPFASSMKVPRKGREFIGRATAALLVTPASMKTLPKRKGNCEGRLLGSPKSQSLNESSSGKEGKRPGAAASAVDYAASMKALPKRKGNKVHGVNGGEPMASMKALPKRKGNSLPQCRSVDELRPASMKALPKRKGNADWREHGN